MTDSRRLLENLPEGTQRDEIRHEKMRLKPIRYGFHRVTTEASPPMFCSKCLDEIHGEITKVNRLVYHPKCFKVSE